MATVEPISLRFVLPELTGEVPSPPHDAMSAPARRHHLANHPRSYLSVTRSPDDLEGDPLDRPEDAAAVALASGRRALEALLAEGAFGPATPPGYFIYRLDQDDHRQTGLVCGVATTDYDHGTVRIHERINAGRAEHLANHLTVVGAQSSPIAMAFKSRPAVIRVIDKTIMAQQPVLDFEDEQGLRQQVWTITAAEDIEEIRLALSNAPLYLIDGHHRAAAASTYLTRSGDPDPERQLMLSTLFPYEELRNQAFHRILSGVDPLHFEALLANSFPVRVTEDPEVVAERNTSELAFGVPIDRTGGIRWTLLDVPFDLHARSDLDNIDPVRLGNKVLGPVLGIDEGNSDTRLSYRPGLADADSIAAMEIDPDQAVFLMRPVPMDILMDASDEGLVMPPKSTYFLPKVRSGLFVRIVDPDLG